MICPLSKSNLIRFGTSRPHYRLLLATRRFSRGQEKVSFKVENGQRKENETLRHFYKQVERKRGELRVQLRQPRFQKLISTLSALNQEASEMERKKQRIDTQESTSGALIPPAVVTLEVLSNGSTSLSPCFMIKTPTRAYIFNCPEGMARFMPSIGAKSTNVYDIFMTRGHWPNIGGVSGILLNREATEFPVRLHGPKGIRQYLESNRPFLDTDFGTCKYPVSAVEMPYDKGSYEDVALTAHYIPLPGKLDSESWSSNQEADTAFLIELKPALPHIDILKIIELRIPKGPLIGQLKAGKEVTLPDGRIIKPEQVISTKTPESEKPTLLVVEIESEDRLKSISYCKQLEDYKRDVGKKQLDYVVHFTRPEIMTTPAYREWMNVFGKGCTHVLLNGSGRATAIGENFYKAQIMLHAIAPRPFPSLYPDFRGALKQEGEQPALESNVIVADNYQCFPMRGVPVLEERATLDFNETTELNARIEEHPQIREAIANFQREAPALLQDSRVEPTEDVDGDQYPIVYFLGTASALPSLHRNVSSHLIRMAQDSYMMVDCGEGTYGQMRILFGPEECDNTLCNLNALFITHAHQDHMSGMIALVMRRREAFTRSNRLYKPIIMVCNANVRKAFGFYSKYFDSLENYVVFVDVSTVSSSARAKHQGNKELTIFSGQRAFLKVEKNFPPALFSPEEWNLREATAVHVHHTTMACGYVFVEHKRGRKLVFSGDTRPCDLLVEQGKEADLLVHEATFEDGLEKDAIRKRHSTVGDAVGVARRMHAKNVILTHFSTRYSKCIALPDYLLEAGNVCIAKDFLVARFNELASLPKLLPLYKELYHAELFELEVKKNQRELKGAEVADAEIDELPTGFFGNSTSTR